MQKAGTRKGSGLFSFPGKRDIVRIFAARKPGILIVGRQEQRR
jgi:hypothetical protein